jgi:ribonuclease J
LRQLHQHAKLAQQAGIAADHIAVVENGQVIEFKNGEMQLGERIPGGYVFVDGSGVGDIDTSVVRERELLARDGFVLINLNWDRETRQLVDTPEIITRGFIHERDFDDLAASITQRIAENMTQDAGKMRDALKQSLRAYLYSETKRRPEIFILSRDV